MAKKKQNSAIIGFVALGCPKNIIDSEKMLAEIAQAGFLIAQDPQSADVVVVNTCGFIAPAKAEALEAIRHAVHCKLNGTVKKVIVAGCLPERLGRQLFEQADGIDAIVGLGQRDNIAQIIRKTIHSNRSVAFLDQSPQTISDDRARLLITPSHWAYLRISEGCNHKCSFCTIPAIRGSFRSKPEKLVLAEAAELVSAGAVELNIIAQDTTCYGRDLKIKNGLSKLLKKLEKIEGLKWIRLMYLCPAGIDQKLIETIAASEKVVHYLDVPIQHVNNEILKAMHRTDTKDRLQRLIENLRSAIPDCLLRTTIIVGFPSETDRQFNELLGFIEWAQFDALGCFKFYRESGTGAADMSAQVPDRVKQQRLDELMLTQQKIAFAKNKSRIGGKLTCLVDSVDNKSTGRGRFYGQAPDIDSICIIQNCSANPGQFIDTKVVGTKDYDLLVQQI
ncbi:MAG: 30S ribosomal protein S12 methylthiotransferase RimO [Planctomycetes bacterium]|nr:30S ribosomal protein S12 methylthiotransferase RimO [Planctomycetota bacterium]